MATKDSGSENDVFDHEEGFDVLFWTWDFRLGSEWIWRRYGDFRPVWENASTSRNDGGEMELSYGAPKGGIY